MSVEARPVAAVRFATDDERVRWDALIAANPGGGEVWQGDAYLEQKREAGRYRVHRLIVELGDEDRTAVAVGVLAKRAPLLGEWWHVPAGPAALDAAGQDPEAFVRATRAVAEFARANGAFLLKIEPRVVASADAERAIRALGAVPTARIIPNPSTVIVDVRGSGAEPRTEDELFASLGKKARYAIKKAARDGIAVERVPASDANCAAFFRLLEETAEGRFVLRSADYYRTFWQRFERAGEGQLFFAYRDGELVAGAFAMGLGSKTTYKDGASVRAKTAYGASHALQWEVLRWALERGAVTHDLCGAPPSGQASDTSHPLHGVGQFKTSFAPQIVDYAGAWDLPLSASKFSVWAKIGDRIARRLSLTVQKDPYY